jgi:predicted DsbA family dithiol-disulfide isomerase
MDDLTNTARDAMACGPEGCDAPGTPASVGTIPATGTRIDIVSDAICPWCYIGKRQLERALAVLGQEGLHFSVHWNPFQLNPDMPAEGRDRAAYRARKFGSAEKAAALDARITEAAAGVGLAFRTGLMTRTPNTIQAHRLIWFAGQRDAAMEQPRDLQNATMEAVFKAYFMQGADIGEIETLAACAAEAGLDAGEVMAFLTGNLAEQEMRAADNAAREAGVSGVPSFFLDGYGLFSGAMPAETMFDALRRGRQVLRERATA